MDKEMNSPAVKLPKLLLATLMFMSLGTVLELYLIDHFEDILQLIPIVCISISLVIVLLYKVKQLKWLESVFRVMLILCALSGLFGAYLHLKANYEFEMEMKSTASTWTLLVESLSGALPALAPGSMILFALIGYAYLIILKRK